MHLTSFSSRPSSLHRLLPLTALLLLPALPTAATAQTVTAPTVITTVPYTITTGGKYILGQDLTNTSATTPAITISANNVNLDLGGFYVSGAGDVSSGNDVILVGDVSDVTIKNGTVANDGYGIEFLGHTDPRNYVVDGVTFTHCYIVGVLFDNTVIGGVVRYSKFSDLGSTSNGVDGQAFGIFTDGGVRIEKNTVDTIAAGPDGESYGIVSVDGNADFAIGNTVANCVYGIYGSIFLNNLTTNISIAAFENVGTNATGNTSASNN